MRSSYHIPVFKPADNWIEPWLNLGNAERERQNPRHPAGSHPNQQNLFSSTIIRTASPAAVSVVSLQPNSKAKGIELISGDKNALLKRAVLS